MQNLLQQAKVYAYRRLAAKAQPKAELFKAMLQRGFPEEIIHQVIQECEALGYINDELWVEAAIRKEAGRLRSRWEIKRKILSKGISPEMIKDLPDDEDALKALIKKKYKGKERQKVIAALLRRGFKLESIVKQISIML